MKYRYGFLLFLFGFLLQSTVFKHLCIMGMSPNITLCLVILLPFLYGGKQGAVLGILFGLLQDLCFGLVIGPMAITYFLIALAMGRLRYTFYRDSLLSIFIAAVTGTVLYVLLYLSLIHI